jgi:hypothetical protein
MSEQNPIDVFISSTCRDLLDLRAVVRADLKDHRFEVRVSEDVASGFAVDPGSDSIEICLKNVEAAKAIVCIVDRKYGTPLTAGPYLEKSPFHAEIEHARSKKKPVFYFIRGLAMRDFEAMKSHPGVAVDWIDESQKDYLSKFWSDVQAYPEHGGGSNWYDVFQNAVDLKETIRRRLIAHFPEYAGTLAMAPDRLVRMTFYLVGAGPNGVAGNFTNLGIGPALNIRHGVEHGNRSSPLPSITSGHLLAGLREGENISVPMISQSPYNYAPTRTRSGNAFKVFCQYENRFGDRYRVEIPFSMHSEGAQIDGDEEFYVAGGSKESPQWNLVS